MRVSEDVRQRMIEWGKICDIDPRDKGLISLGFEIDRLYLREGNS